MKPAAKAAATFQRRAGHEKSSFGFSRRWDSQLPPIFTDQQRLPFPSSCQGPGYEAITRQYPHRHRVRMEGQKDFGQKNGDIFPRFLGPIKTPRFQTLRHLAKTSPLYKKSSFCPKIFLPTLPALDREDPSSPLFNGLPPPQSVPICESAANPCPSVFESFTPSTVKTRIGIESGQKNGDKRIRFSCPHSPAVPPTRGTDRAEIG